MRELDRDYCLIELDSSRHVSDNDITRFQAETKRKENEVTDQLNSEKVLYRQRVSVKFTVYCIAHQLPILIGCRRSYCQYEMLVHQTIFQMKSVEIYFLNLYLYIFCCFIYFL